MLVLKNIDKVLLIKITFHIFSFILFVQIAIYGQDSLRQVMVDSIYILDKIESSEDLVIVTRHRPDLSFIETLDNRSFGALRSGGLSVLSTMLHRGMASRHMGILWGGFNIQSVVNGTFDLNLVSNTFDDVKLYSNGTSSFSGNASMAGALALNNSLGKGYFTSIHSSYNSANNLHFTFIDKTNYKSYSHHIALNHISDDNEYRFVNNTGNVEKQQQAAFQMIDFNYTGRWVVTERVRLTLGAWLQNVDRDIPPTKTSASILQEQKDENYRAFLELTYYPTIDSKINFRSAYFNESLEYESPGVYSLAESDILNAAIDFSYKSSFNASLQYRKDKVDATFFEPIHQRTTVALMGNWNYTIKNMNLGVSVRPEMVDGEFQPLTLSAQIGKAISDNIKTELSFNRGYTLPSFNDLFWPTGGNQDLKTEKITAVNLEVDLNLDAQLVNSLSFNFYYNDIDDWIQWLPVNGFFQPVNHKKVRNLGFDFRIGNDFKISSTQKLSMNLMYAFTDSRLLKDYRNPDNEGKKTVFVPTHKLTGQVRFVYDTWILECRPIYYSKRFDTVDNSTNVPGFFLLDLDLMKQFKIGNTSINLSLGIENSLNNNYENVRFYPMPLRLFRAGLNLKLDK